MATSSGREDLPAEGAGTRGTTITGGAKPLHRFLRAEPKSVGIVLVFLGLAMFMFGFPMKTSEVGVSSDLYTSFWLGILYFICGILYVQAERVPTKKIVVISLALSIIAILGTIFAVIDFSKAMISMSQDLDMEYIYLMDNLHEGENYTTMMNIAKENFMMRYNLEAVFLFHSLVALVILITMSAFARMALRSSRTQVVVVMRNIPSTE